MADCYYHGQSPPGPCPDCKTEREHDQEQGSSEGSYRDWTPKDFDDTESKRYRKKKGG
jgi:hypothetical protein